MHYPWLGEPPRFFSQFLAQKGQGLKEPDLGLGKKGSGCLGKIPMISPHVYD
jgi:hypothetical protein